MLGPPLPEPLDHARPVRCGQRWESRSGGPPIAVCAREVHVPDEWGVTVAGTVGMVTMTTGEIVAGYRLVSDMQAPLE